MIIENDHIYNMDCLDGMRDIPSKSIDCVVTDCPYRICSGGVRLVPDGKECGGVLKKQQKVQPTSKLGERWLHNDGSVTPFAMNGKMFANNDIKFSEWLPDVYRVLKDGTHCYIMVNSRNLKELQQAAGIFFTSRKYFCHQKRQFASDYCSIRQKPELFATLFKKKQEQVFSDCSFISHSAIAL